MAGLMGDINVDAAATPMEISTQNEGATNISESALNTSEINKGETAPPADVSSMSMDEIEQQTKAQEELQETLQQRYEMLEEARKAQESRSEDQITGQKLDAALEAVEEWTKTEMGGTTEAKNITAALKDNLFSIENPELRKNLAGQLENFLAVVTTAARGSTQKRLQLADELEKSSKETQRKEEMSRKLVSLMESNKMLGNRLGAFEDRDSRISGATTTSAARPKQNATPNSVAIPIVKEEKNRGGEIKNSINQKTSQQTNNMNRLGATTTSASISHSAKRKADDGPQQDPQSRVRFTSQPLMNMNFASYDDLKAYNLKGAEALIAKCKMTTISASGAGGVQRQDISLSDCPVHLRPMFTTFCGSKNNGGAKTLIASVSNLQGSIKPFASASQTDMDQGGVSLEQWNPSLYYKSFPNAKREW